MLLYKLSNSEFMQFRMAEGRLKSIKQQHAIELEEAYDNIHPTRVCFDYGLGRLYSESLNPANYAIYLVEMQEEHKNIENYWSTRAEAYKQAVLSSKSEKKEKVKEALCQIVAYRPELQRKENLDLIEDDVEEYDRLIDKMKSEELFKDYLVPFDEEERIRG